MITQTITIPHTSVHDIYTLLLDGKTHTQLTGDKATIDPRVGGAVSTFGGYATGTISKLIPDTLIALT